MGLEPGNGETVERWRGMERAGSGKPHRTVLARLNVIVAGGGNMPCPCHAISSSYGTIMTRR